MIASKVNSIKFDKTVKKYLFNVKIKDDHTITFKSTSPYFIMPHKTILLKKINNFYIIHFKRKIMYIGCNVTIICLLFILNFFFLNLDQTQNYLLFFSYIIFSRIGYSIFSGYKNHKNLWKEGKIKKGIIVSKRSTNNDPEWGNSHVYVINVSDSSFSFESKISSNIYLNINSEVDVIYPKGYPELGEIKSYRLLFGSFYIYSFLLIAFILATTNMIINHI